MVKKKKEKENIVRDRGLWQDTMLYQFLGLTTKVIDTMILNHGFKSNGHKK